MTTTNKKDLIERIAEETKQTQTAVKKTVQSFLNYVIEELSRGNRVEFRGFGVFEIRERSPRQAMNPRTKETITIEARKTVKFKVGHLMKRALDGQCDDSADGKDGLTRKRQDEKVRTIKFDGELQSAR